MKTICDFSSSFSRVSLSLEKDVRELKLKLKKRERQLAASHAQLRAAAEHGGAPEAAELAQRDAQVGQLLAETRDASAPGGTVAAAQAGEMDVDDEEEIEADIH